MNFVLIKTVIIFILVFWPPNYTVDIVYPCVLGPLYNLIFETRFITLVAAVGFCISQKRKPW